MLWSEGAERRLPVASLSKMMVALLALEHGGLERVVAVSDAATREAGTRIGLKAGERLRAADLLTATVVRSANDACRALADSVAPDFVARMNRRAAEIGMRDTRFVERCGHDREGQYSSAADLALLAEQIMRSPEYMRLAALPKARIATADGSRSFELNTTNALIGRVPGVIGVKTGYTSGAGHCLVALAERNGVRVLVVMLNATNRWWHAAGLIERAYAGLPP